MASQDRRLKVLFWPGWWYPGPGDPCNGIFIKKHAQAVARFCSVSVLYVSRDPELRNKKYHQVTSEEDGIPTFRISFNYSARTPRFITRLLEVFRSYQAAKIGRKLVNNRFGEPDLLHVHVNPPLGIILYLLRRDKSHPRLFTEHWSGYFPEDGGYRGVLRKWLFRQFLKRCQGVTCVSVALQTAMLNQGLINSYHIIPNVADKSIFFPAKGPPDRPQIKTILHVSNLAPVKNIKGIISTVLELVKIRQDFRLLIIGGGPFLEKWVAYRDQKKIAAEYIEFLGHQPVTQVAEFMRRSQFLLLFSDYENSPCVIAEALCCGLPVVSTDVGGVREHVNAGNGMLVRPGDDKGLLDTLVKMLNRYFMYDKPSLARNAQRTFDSPVVGRQFLDLYQKILTASSK